MSPKVWATHISPRVLASSPSPPVYRSPHCHPMIQATLHLSQGMGQPVISPSGQNNLRSLSGCRPTHHFSGEPTSCAIYHRVNGTKNTDLYLDNFHQTSVADCPALPPKCQDLFSETIIEYSFMELKLVCRST